MKKKLTTIGMAALVLGTGFLNTSCFGEFSLIRKVYTWNQGVAGDDMGGRFLKTLLFYGLSIIPVYPIAGMVDMIILNLIEFWTGSNPIAMGPGEVEEQYAEIDGKRYKITATQNTLTYEEVKDGELIPLGQMVFNPENTSWNYANEGEMTMLYQIKAQPNGNDIIEYTDLQGNLAWTNIRSLEANYEDYLVKK